MDEAFQIKCEDLTLSITLVTNHLKISNPYRPLNMLTLPLNYAVGPKYFRRRYIHFTQNSHSIVMPGVELSCAYAYFKVDLTSCLLNVHIETRKNASKCLTFWTVFGIIWHSISHTHPKSWLWLVWGSEKSSHKICVLMVTNLIAYYKLVTL